MNLKVSIVIATYNRTKCLLDTLESFKLQDYYNYEIIVVDQSEQTSLININYFNANPDIIYYKLDKPNRCRSKTFGAMKSTGDIIIICDDDIIAPPNLITTHLYHYQNPSIGAGVCRVLEVGQPDDVYLNKVLKVSFYGRIYNNAFSKKSMYIKSLNGSNMSFRKELFLKAGPLDERFIGTGIMEEPDIAYRIRKMGYKIFFDASTTVMHYPQYNGNIAEMKANRAIWFYSYSHNLAFYFKKNKIYHSLILAFPFLIILNLKHCLKYRLSIKDFFYMISGYFRALKQS